MAAALESHPWAQGPVTSLGCGHEGEKPLSVPLWVVLGVFAVCWCSQEGLVIHRWVWQSCAWVWLMQQGWSQTCCTKLSREIILLWVLGLYFPELRQQFRALPSVHLIPPPPPCPHLLPL